MEEDFNTNFLYSSNVDIFHIVEEIIKGEYYEPTNPYQFTFKLNSNELCENPIKLMFLVKTSTQHFSRRNAIRNTWGSSKNYKEIRTIFLVGEKTEENLKLKRENEIFKDIVQGNFSDTYYNLTLKAMMGLQWANNFCLNNTEYFMFVDDDYYVSTKNILKFIENPFLYPETENKKNIEKINPDTFSLYAGHVQVNAGPIRKFYDKWYISLDKYPYNKYPPFASSVYILSKKTINRMYYASLFIEPLPFEDVYVGILAYYLRITPISNKKNILRNSEKYNFLKFRNVLASTGFEDPDELWNVWNEQNFPGDTKILL